MINAFFSFLGITVPNTWQLVEIVIVVVWVYGIRRCKISGKKSALVGFCALFITMICNIFSLNQLAGMVAEYTWIFFAISFVQEFYHFLRYENK